MWLWVSNGKLSHMEKTKGTETILDTEHIKEPLNPQPNRLANPTMHSGTNRGSFRSDQASVNAIDCAVLYR